LLEVPGEFGDEDCGDCDEGMDCEFELELEFESELDLELESRLRAPYSVLSRYPSPFLSHFENCLPIVLSDEASLREIRPSPSVSAVLKLP
jgi:hypothetical protein